MTLRALFYMLLVACVTGVPTTSAQSNPSGEVSSSRPMQPTIDRLLQLARVALDHFQQVLAPALRCNQAVRKSRESCQGWVKKLQDEAQQATQDVARYRTSRAPEDLFDTYVHLQSLLKNIEIFAVQDNGDNQQAIVEGYNSFVKVTGVWFTLEMKQIIGSCAR